MEINQLVKDAHDNALKHGWHDEDRSFGELIALCHSELSEALEEHRNGRLAMETYYPEKTCMCPPSDNCPGCSCTECKHYYMGKPEGIPVELADVVIRIADMCGLFGIDLDRAIADKMQYNKKRPYRHGGKVI